MEINFEELLALCKSGRVNLRSDSRLVEKGDIFVALAGDSIDGTAFIPQAVEKLKEFNRSYDEELVLSEKYKAFEDYLKQTVSGEADGSEICRDCKIF